MSIPQVWLREAIEDATGYEVHPLGVPEGLNPPYVIYTRTATSRELVLDDTLDSPAGGSAMPPVATITVEIYRDDYVEVWETSAAIVGAIHGYSGGDIVSCLVTDEADAPPVFMDGRDTPTYAVELSVEIRYAE